jgi:feruloyl-CoA synthase
MDAGEITDKGSINQRVIIERHPETLEELYLSETENEVIEIGALVKSQAGY